MPFSQLLWFDSSFLLSTLWFIGVPFSQFFGLIRVSFSQCSVYLSALLSILWFDSSFLLSMLWFIECPSLNLISRVKRGVYTRSLQPHPNKYPTNSCNYRGRFLCQVWIQCHEASRTRPEPNYVLFDAVRLSLRTRLNIGLGRM